MNVMHLLLIKQKYVAARKEDTLLVKTTVGLPGRVIANQFTDLLNRSDKIKIEKCRDCLKHCSYRFCLMDSLLKVVDGDIENGLVFAGARVHEIHDILPVQKIIENLTTEYSAINTQGIVY